MYEFFSIPNGLIALINIILNSLLTFVLWKLGKLQTISFRFIFIQSSCDVLVGITMLLTRIVIYVTNEHSCSLITYTYIACDSLCGFSAIMITLIAVDRFIHMRFLNRYSDWMNSQRAITMVLFNVFISVIIVGVQVLGHFENSYVFSHVVLNCIAIGLMISASFVYCNAYRSLNRRTRQLNLERSLPVNTTSEANNNPAGNAGALVPRRKRNASQEFLKVMVIVLTSLILTYTPFVVSWTVIYMYRENEQINDKILLFHFFSRLFVCINSSLNATLFLSMNRELRRYASRVLRCSPHDLRGNDSSAGGK